MSPLEELRNHPEREGFVLAFRDAQVQRGGPLFVCGRLQLYVRAGSQYAIWRQFPQAFTYEVKTADGGPRETPDMSLSISEGPGVHEQYAALPSECVVGEDFDLDISAFVGALLPENGACQLRARYMGLCSNWLQVPS